MSKLKEEVLRALDKEEPFGQLGQKLSEFAASNESIIKNPTYARLRVSRLTDLDKILGHMSKRPSMYLPNEVERTASSLILFLTGFWYGIKHIGFVTSVEPALDSLLGHFITKYGVGHLIDVAAHFEENSKIVELPDWDLCHLEIQLWFTNWQDIMPMNLIPEHLKHLIK